MKKTKKKITDNIIKNIKANFAHDLQKEIDNPKSKRASPQRELLNHLKDELKSAVNHKLSLAQIARLVNRNSPIKISHQTIKLFIVDELKLEIFKQKKKPATAGVKKETDFMRKFDGEF